MECDQIKVRWNEMRCDQIKVRWNEMRSRLEPFRSKAQKRLEAKHR